ncbi:MAG: hypothetical protein QXL86_00050 [Candidatus Aenigmatarchaeota archaeon]
MSRNTQNRKTEEIRIMRIDFTEEDRKLIAQSINEMNRRIVLYYKMYGDRGIVKASEMNNIEAKKLFDLALSSLRSQLMDVIVGIGIPNSYQVRYIPYSLEGYIEQIEITGRFNTYDSNVYRGSITFIRNRKSNKEETYFLLEAENSIVR